MGDYLRLVKKGKRVICGIEFPIYHLYLGEKLLDKGNEIKVFFKDFSQSLLVVYFKSEVVDVLHPGIWKKAVKEGKLDRVYSWMKITGKGIGPVKESSIVFLKKEGETEKKKLLFFLPEGSIFYPIPGEWDFNGFRAEKLDNGKILVYWGLENRLWPDLSHIEKTIVN